MKRKTFRSFYLSNELNERLQKQARLEDTSASRIVRLALQEYLNVNPGGREYVCNMTKQ